MVREDNTRQIPVQCEDDPNPNHCLVVYETESYEWHSTNVTTCEQVEVDFDGQEVIFWGEWSHPLVGSPVLRREVTSSAAVTSEDDGDVELPLGIVLQTTQPFHDVSDLHSVHREILGMITYTEGPEEEENSDEEDGEKEDSDFSPTIY